MTSSLSPEPRRQSRGAFFAMCAGLAAGYGALVAIAIRFLYPARAREPRWLYVCRTGDLAPGESISWQGPRGETIAITRGGDGDDQFLALSSVCPHLGCQVTWEAQNKRFFCPCHNGIFAPDGKAVSGPPALEKQDLPRYELKVVGNLLYIGIKTA